MPCNAKKLEATRGNFTRKVHMKDDWEGEYVKEVDLVLTTKEFLEVI
jgi:iron only hydrogenase large subunit-like protein